jgi:NAD(P)-dependent dehydrogenase (short-subunit alcohol dehydrogenase family)
MTKRVALVTGGARGIGLGISKALAGAGFDLALCGVRPPQQAAEALKDLPGALYVQADVGEREARARLLAEVRRRFGRLDVLVNNAGITSLGRMDILEATEESYDRVMSTNLKGPYFLTQAAARWMAEEKKADAGFSGCVVFITSISAVLATPNRGDYCLSKAALAMATQLWAARLAEFGIAVYEVRPGVIKSDMTAPVTAKYDKLIAEGLTIEPRWGTPEDVGKAVALLARGDLPYATGQVLTVDGGLLVRRL